jgi:hypothetical protein
MPGDFSDVIRTIEQIKMDGVISDYAIGGAVAFIVWDEPVATQDLDVVVLVAGEAHALDPLRPVFDWLAQHGIALDGEHAMISGVPVQFLPAWHPLLVEGVREAATVPYDRNDTTSVMLRVLRPAYLVASWQIDPSADTFRRRERVARLIETGTVTRSEIDALIERHRR